MNIEFDQKGQNVPNISSINQVKVEISTSNTNQLIETAPVSTTFNIFLSNDTYINYC